MLLKIIICIETTLFYYYYVPFGTTAWYRKVQLTSYCTVGTKLSRLYSFQARSVNWVVPICLVDPLTIEAGKAGGIYS